MPLADCEIHINKDLIRDGWDEALGAIWHEYCHAAEFSLTGKLANSDRYDYWERKSELLAWTVPRPPAMRRARFFKTWCRAYGL